MLVSSCTNSTRLCQVGRIFTGIGSRILKFHNNRNVSNLGVSTLMSNEGGDTREMTHRQVSTSSKALSSATLEKALATVFSEEHKIMTIQKMKNIKPLRTLSRKQVATKQGAVCVPLCIIDGQPSILFTLRSNQLVTHRGEVSFPGGMSDKGDKDLTHTALRELEEELGYDTSKVDVWGSLIRMPDKTGDMAITPVVAFMGDIDLDKLQPNHNEVEEVFMMTVKQLCTPENQRYTKFISSQSEGKTFAMPVFVGGPHRIWGLTAIATDQLLRVLLPGVYKPSVVNMYGRRN